jgi:hypothetical protein
VFRLLALVCLIAGCLGTPNPPTTEPTTELPNAEAGFLCEVQTWTREYTFGSTTVRVPAFELGGYIYEDRKLAVDTKALQLFVEWNQTFGQPRLVVAIDADKSIFDGALVEQAGDSPLRLEVQLNETLREVRVRTRPETTDVGPVGLSASAPVVMHYELTEISDSCVPTA